MRIIWRYRGPERRLWARGPNWWQVTLSLFGWRVAVIRWWPSVLATQEELLRHIRKTHPDYVEERDNRVPGQ
jgi:hypothetical protein